MPTAPTVLLHLSDIHFRGGRSGTPHDLDLDLRDQLQRNVLTLRDRLGVIHGVVVSGDVGFSGDKEDYAIAAAWLRDLCNDIGCDNANVWTVPGNHDIQRDVISKSETLQLLHRELRAGPAHTLDGRLRKYLADDEEAAAMLFRPLQNYNAFARQFDCDISEKRICWTHDIVLNDGSILRLHGANSTIVSDDLDCKRTAPLVVGQAQSLIRQEDGVEHVFICHHPPDWLIDQDLINDNLRTRTRLQLFGHKHEARAYTIGESLRIAAGATHPSRSEARWEPTFNVISIMVETRDGIRTMELHLFTHIWSRQDVCFKAESSSDGTDYRRYSFRLAPWVPKMPSQDASTMTSAAGEEGAASVLDLRPTGEDTRGRLVNPARRLTYRFMSLAYQVRIEVVQRLGLIDEQDGDMQDSERYHAYFRRARERHLLPDLWDAVERAHGVDPTENPFADVQDEESNA